MKMPFTYILVTSDVQMLGAVALMLIIVTSEFLLYRFHKEAGWG